MYREYAGVSSMSIAGTVESKYPVLVLSFNNCELHCCHMDGYKNNKEALSNRLGDIERYFVAKPKSLRYRLWYNVDDSVLSDEIIERIAIDILAIGENIIKLAFIGAGIYKRRLTKLLKMSAFDKPFKYFGDAEIAKEWLV